MHESHCKSEDITDGSRFRDTAIVEPAGSGLLMLQGALFLQKKARALEKNSGAGCRGIKHLEAVATAELHRARGAKAGDVAEGTSAYG